jgi:hypothetical protein
VEIVHDFLSALLSLLAGLGLGILTGLALPLLAWAALALLGLPVALVKLVRAKRAARRAAWARPWYSLTLLVRLDEENGRFYPSAQLRGEGALRRAWIRLELVDNLGNLRLVMRRRLPRAAIGTELPLPDFEPPDGASAAVVLGWHWDVVIESKHGKRMRWREHPRAAGQLNAEAELA